MMAGKVQGGLLGRWFEELCRLKFEKLEDIVVSNQSKLRFKILPDKGGIYTFWWTGDIQILKNCNRNLILHGPAGKDVILEIDDDWLGIDADLPIPLYVGKTVSGIRKRVGQHLKLGSKGKILKYRGGAKKLKAPTTSCQLRADIEHLFPIEKEPLSLILPNIGISYVLLEGDRHAANRFYLEDMAIGLMRPPLNVDVEK
jgi:hypothetical protein